METDNLQNDPKELMRLAKAGQAQAYGALYELYFTPIFRYIYLRVKDKEEANDLTQTVFLKVFTALPNFTEQSKSSLAYFFTVSRNTVIDYWRSKKEIKADDLDSIAERTADDGAGPQKSYEDKENQAFIHRALQELTDVQQEVITLKFISELSNKEIAELLGNTEEAVRQLQCRALKSLKIILKNQKYYE
jgi:RNA polymerase sigma-70 factor (ECF subfamily)